MPARWALDWLGPRIMHVMACQEASTIHQTPTLLLAREQRRGMCCVCRRGVCRRRGAGGGAHDVTDMFRQVRLTKESWTMPAEFPVQGSRGVVPLFAGDNIAWKAHRI